MGIEPEHPLQSIADAITDETPVDWDGELARSPRAATTLGHLRALAELGRVTRPDPTDARVVNRNDPATLALFRWGPLAALELLGAGSFGEVYRAWDPALRREVALKLRRNSGAAGSDRRWLEEARRLARVRHPNVLVVHGADVHDGRAGLWTDLLEGATLEELLRDRGAFGAREAALIGVELCAALAAVHAAGLVHGDVKTQNVMREGEAGAADGSGRIVLMDFGSAHEADPGGGGDGSAFGTPLAVAPEVLSGDAPTPASDVYALGVLLFRLTTGRYPVEAATVSELVERTARGERAALRTVRPDLPATFVAAVERALEPSPANRFPDAAAMERALAAALAATPGSSVRTARGRSAGRVVFIAAGIAVAAVAALAWVLLGPGRTPPRGSSHTAAADGVPAGGPPGAAPSAAVVPGTTPPAVEAELVRGEDALGEPLASGDVVAPGDRIALELRSPEAVHAYVLSEDDAGALFVLFPLKERGAKNPLAPGVRHRLPGADGARSLDWVVTSAGGRETFLLLAARAPLAAVERAVAELPAAKPGEAVRYAPLGSGAAQGLRAIGEVAPSAETTPVRGARKLAALAAALDATPEGRAVWRRLIVLENPAR